MKKRITAFFVAIVMLFCAMPVITVSALTSEATNVTTGYSSTLKNVLSRVSAGDTVVLNANVNTGEQLTLGSAITVDGKGFSINYTGTGTALVIKDAVTLTGVSVIAPSGNGCDLTANASLTMKEARIEAGVSYAIQITGANASVTVNSGGLKAPTYLILGGENVKVNIYDGSFIATAESDAVRMFQMTSGEWNYYGGRYEAKRGYVFNASSNPVMNVYGGSYIFTGSSENLWNIRDNSVANFYGGYFYAPNHGSPFLVRGTKNAVMNVYGGSYFAADTTPFSSVETGMLNEYGGSFYDLTFGIETECFETVGNVTPSASK